MNESLLNALIKLFAIIADVKHYTNPEIARKVIEEFFIHQFGKSESKRFIQYFNDHLQKYHYSLPENTKTDISVYHSRIEQICFAINKEFEQKQKLWLTLQLLEFLSDCDYTSKEEIGIVREIAKAFNVDQDDFELGRAFLLSQDNAVPLTEKTLVISRNSNFSHPAAKHLFSKRMDGKIYVLQLKSTDTYLLKYIGEYNLFLNGLNIKTNRAYIWAMGAVIRSSRIDPIYYSNMTGAFIDQENIPRIEFVARDVSYRFFNSKKGLEKFDFEGESGQLIGIVGSSGSGKSTVLNVLNGNLKQKTGKISINGYDIHEDKKALEGVIGYVPQEDLLFEELTVYENLFFNARLCFSKFNKEQLDKLVDKTIESFDLVEAKDLKVGDPLNKILSGGQRKRLNIALELMREPSLLFVDEPTSGLSSMDSEKILNLLKRQTFKGKLVILTIHQPSSDLFKLFDKIVIVDQGGRIIYSGNPLDSIAYFREKANYIKPEESECITCGNVNSEQILRIVESRVVNEFGKLIRKRKRPPEEWEELFKTEIKPIDEDFSGQKKPLPETNFNIPGSSQQFKIFFQRNLLSKLSNKQYLLLILFEAPLLAIILGLFTKHYNGPEDNPNLYIFANNENLPAYIFMSVIVALFLGLIISAEEIIRDKKIIKRESFLNLSRWSYINSKTSYLIIISAFQSLLFVLIGNYILHIRNLDFVYWLMLFSTSVCANIIGLNISSAFNSVVSSYITIPFILVPQLLLSGVVVDYKKIHKDITSVYYTPLFGDLMTSRWAYEGLIVEQFKDNKFQKYFYDVEKRMSRSDYIISFYIPKLISIYESLQSTSGKDTTSDNNHFQLLENELNKLAENANDKAFYSLANNLRSNYKSAEYKVQFDGEINLLKNKQINILNQGRHQKEAIYYSLVKKLGSNSAFSTFKQKHYNQSIANLVLDKMSYKKISIYDNEIIQFKDPIYKFPKSTYGRAHFFSSVKVIGKFEFDTYWFNLVVIWIFSFIMYILLQLDLIRKAVENIEIIKVTKGYSKKILRV